MADELLPDLVVKFKGDMRDLLAAFAEAKAAAREFSNEVDGTRKKVKKDTDGMGQDAKDFERLLGSKLKDGEAAYKSLQREVENTRTKIAQLRKDFSSTGSQSVFGDLKKAESDLKKLEGFGKAMGISLEKAFAKNGASAAEAWSSTFMDSWESLPIGPMAMAVLIGVAAAAAPAIISIISAAVIAGFGAAGVGAGVLLALRNPAIKTAIGGLGHDLMTILGNAVAPFDGPILAGIQHISTGFQEMAPELEGMFSAASKLLIPLVDGVMGLIHNALPGLTKGFDQAAPLFAVLATQLPLIGTAIGHFFDVITRNGPAARLSMMALVGAFVGIITIVGKLIAVSQDFFMWFEQRLADFGSMAGAALVTLGSNIPFVGDKIQNAGFKLEAFGAHVQGLVDKANEVPTAATSVVGAFNMVSGAVDNATQALQADIDAMNKYVDAALAIDDANLNMHQAMTAFQQALKQNKHNWDLNTVSGQNLYQAFLNDFKGITKYYEGLEKAQPANMGLLAAQLKSEKALYAQAKAAGATDDELKTLRDSIQKLQDKLNALHGKKVKVEVKFLATGSGLAMHNAVAQGGVRYAQGGVDYAGARAFAQSGIDGGARAFAASGVYSGGAGSLVKFAEPSTGGEAYIARNGDRGRQFGALMTAIGWMGERSPLSHSTTYNISNTQSSSGGGGMLVAYIMLDGMRIARALVPYNQRTKLRTGTTGQA